MLTKTAPMLVCYGNTPPDLVRLQINIAPIVDQLYHQC
jgi:hypothetical protein